jgi:lipoprotein-anchoring transpeptidase ErfK/SrfK
MRRTIAAMFAVHTLAMLAADAAWTQASAQPGTQAVAPPAGPSLASLPKGVDAAVLKAEVVLDRAGLSPGVIDGHNGDNFRKALAAFQERNGLAATGKLDAPTSGKLDAAAQEPALIDYEIVQADVQGPFAEKLPQKLEDMAKLPRLAYASPREALAEKFHMSEGLLQALNRKARFDAAGTHIRVANVAQGGGTTGAGQAGSRTDAAKVERIEVNKRDHVLRAFDKDERLVAFYPASIGSTEKPAPTGRFKVTRVQRDPAYHYDPKFHFKGVKTQHKLTIPPGPNNPVGAVWIDLTAPSYGIHGTPNPDKIGKTESHGCIRLTNWDALALAAMVHKGTQVDFVE